MAKQLRGDDTSSGIADGQLSDVDLLEDLIFKRDLYFSLSRSLSSKENHVRYS